MLISDMRGERGSTGYPRGESPRRPTLGGCGSGGEATRHNACHEIDEAEEDCRKTPMAAAI